MRLLRWPLSYYWYRLKWWWCEFSNWVPKVPLHLDLELTNQCNLACTMCRHGINPDPIQGQMDYTMATALINEAAKMGIYSIKFQFRGESALNKDLETLITYSKNMGIRHTQLNTNLVAFSEQRLIKLCQSGLDRLIISIDGANRKTYEQIRCGARWSRLVYLLGVIHLQDRRPVIRIQMVHQKANRQEIDTFIDKFSPLCDELHVKSIRSDNKGRQRKSCAQPRQRLVIAWDGDVFGCCNAWYGESLLDVVTKTNTIETIWNSTTLHTFRNKAKKPQCTEPCKSCLVRSSYK